MTVYIYVDKRFFPITYFDVYKIWYKDGYLYISNRCGLYDRFCRPSYKYFEVDWRA